MLNNKKIYDSALKLKEELKDLPLIKEYNFLAKQVENNSYLCKCEEELKKMQKDLVHLLDNGEKEQYEITLSNYLKLKQEYENN